jgi:flavin reductase (DIM6/NTAB) family NADH-FMN oxidoreductase RutF
MIHGKACFCRGKQLMKKKLGSVNALYPMPVVLVGANIEGKPNYTTIAHVGIMTIDCIAVSSNKTHYINAGIKANQTFSVNIPSEDLVRQTDYCGMVSGRTEDKSLLFENFYGTLRTAPMIEDCPLNMECQLVETVDIGAYNVFIGQVIETWCDEACLTDEKVDLAKVKPFLFDMPRKCYWRIGEPFAQPWSVGKDLRK